VTTAKRATYLTLAQDLETIEVVRWRYSSGLSLREAKEGEKI